MPWSIDLRHLLCVHGHGNVDHDGASDKQKVGEKTLPTVDAFFDFSPHHLRHLGILTQLNLTMPFPFQISEHVIDGQYIREYPRATAAPDSPLKLCIKQYTPIDNPNPQPGDVTIVATHGTGFPKVC